MDRKRKLALLAGLVLMLGLASLTPAVADVEYNDKFAFSVTVENPCNGEVVDFYAEAHVVGKSKQKGDCFEVDFHLNGHAQGIGSFGNKYIAVHNAKTTEVTCDPYNFTFSSFEKVRFISQGSADNFYAMVKYTFKVENGDITEGTISLGPECPG